MLEEMDQLIAQHGLFPRGVTVLCAISGGADSVCLLHRLYHLRRSLGIRLVAAHYNHKLRGEESERDEQFVRQFVALCCGRDVLRLPDGRQEELPPVELVVGSGDVRGESFRRGKGLEETAREMRYAFLRDCARQVGAQRIATAHNADDNAETVLLHLLRGSGLRGLGGIAPLRGDLARPLLTCSRQQIEAYLRFYGMPWVEDSSNRSDDFLRNRLRHQVVPALEDICPGARLRIGQTAALLREDEAYLNELARARLEGALLSQGHLSIPAEALSRAPEPVAVRCVQQLVARVTQGNDNCTAAHIEAVLGVSRSPDPAARTQLPGAVQVRREYGQLIFERRRDALIAPPPVPLRIEGETRFGSYTVTCRPEQYRGQRCRREEFYLSRVRAGTITLRTRQIGDELRPAGRRRKSLKKWFIDEKIPKLLRDRLPVLDVEGRPAAVALLGADEAFLPQVGDACWHIIISRKCEH